MEEYTLSQLEAALSDLKEQQRICLDLVYLQGKTYQEVSEMTGFGMNEVKSHVQNGKRNLKIKLVSVNGKKN
jgi:RNA polymerase sigma-70 factor (ECF subfamily)